MSEEKKPLTILVVDDDPCDRHMFQQFLCTDPHVTYEFIEVETGREGIECCCTYPVDCVILDYALPDTDGLDFLVNLADRMNEHLLPVVMVTGQGSEAIATLAIKSGAQDYLTKATLTPDALQLAVRNAVLKVRLLRKIDEQRFELEAANAKLLAVNRELQQMNQLKSEFLANASHELRTPLNSILGFLRLIADGMCSSHEEEIDFINTALQSAQMLLDLINDLLDISKIEAGKMILDLEEIRSDRLFDDVYIMTQLSAKEKGLTLEFHLPEGTYPTIRGDYNKLKQALINLTSNAVKFTPAGSVTVTARPVSGRGHFEIEVKDTGLGVRPEMQERIFDKFVQGDGSMTRQHGGTGLGLTITRSLVQLMGGMIRLESEGENQGTTVTLTIPLYDPKDVKSRCWHAEAEQEAVVKGNPENPLLLVVEDDARFRTMIEKLAHEAGYSTIAALTADDALGLARKMNPVAITMDHALLVAEHATLTTGWDAYKALKADRTTADIPVILVSGYEGEMREQFKELSDSAAPLFLLKPFDQDEFMGILEKARSQQTDEQEEKTHPRRGQCIEPPSHSNVSPGGR